MKERQETTSVGRRTRRIVAARRRRSSLAFHTDAPIRYALTRDELRSGMGSELAAHSYAVWAGSTALIPREVFARAIDRPALLMIRETIQ